MGQEDKSFINLAGEFLVAGELNRRRVLASVTYGESKRADIFAFSSDEKRFARIEVKATDKRRWPVGARALNAKSAKDGVFWVLVHLPIDDALPEYFIFSGRELVDLASRQDKAYKSCYKVKNGKDFTGRGVPALRYNDVIAYQNRWQTILAYIKR